MTTDVRLAFAPGATYARLVQDRTSGHAGALLAGLALAVAIIGTSVASAATGRVSLALVRLRRRIVELRAAGAGARGRRNDRAGPLAPRDDAARVRAVAPGASALDAVAAFSHP